MDFNDVISDKLLLIDNFKDVSIVIDKYFNNIDTSQLLDFPNVLSKEEIAKLKKGKLLSTYKLIPASAFGIVSKRGESMGILNELGELSQKKDFSLPLKSLFSNQDTPVKSFKIGKTPSILSASQTNAVKAASNYPISLIIGPPGTGKSFTIASLAIEHLSKNKSVLIVSKSDKAVDVVSNKIENELQLQNTIVRGGKSQYLKQLKETVELILNRNHFYEHIKRYELDIELMSIDDNIKRKNLLVDKFNQQVQSEIKKGSFLNSC